MKAYYFHGISSKGYSEKASLIRGMLRQYHIDLIEVSFNQKNPNIYDINQIVRDTKRHILKSTNERERVILIGSSFGCYILNNLISKIDSIKIFKIIYLSPLFDFSHLDVETDKSIDQRRIEYILNIDNNSIKIIDYYSVDKEFTLEKKPLLIIHGLNDKIVSFEHSQKYKTKVSEEILNSQTELILLESDHRLSINTYEVIDNIDNFLFRYGKYKILTFTFNDPLTKLWKDEIFYVLKDSYGSKYFGDSYHLKKFEKWNVRFFLAFNFHRKLIACSYICPDGKHIAIGVLKSHRRQGIAMNLFKFSFQIINKQYAEVSEPNMERILRSLGFSHVNNELKLKEILGNEKYNLIESRQIQNGILSYKRKSAQSDLRFKFKLMKNY